MSLLYIALTQSKPIKIVTKRYQLKSQKDNNKYLTHPFANSYNYKNTYWLVLNQERIG